MINVYLDASGSMTEMGKDQGSAYVAKSVIDYCKAYGIEVVIKRLDGNIMKDLGKLSGSIAENSILLSDGLFECENENMFDITIAIGIDSDRKLLEKISVKTFQSDDLLKALEYLIFNYGVALSSKQVTSDDEW